MNIVINDHDCKSFFEILYGGITNGFLSLFNKKQSRASFVDLCRDDAIEKAASIASSICRIGSDVYYTCGLHKSIPQRGRGDESNIIGIPGLWMDIDTLEGFHRSRDLPTMAQANDFLESFPLKPTMMICSGGGLHAYWLMREFWHFGDNEKKDARILSDRFQYTLASHAKDKGWNLDITSDLSRLLRIPGTFNFKKEPKYVSILSAGGPRYNISDFDPYLISFEFDQTSLDGNSGHLEFVIEKCAFLRHCRDNAKILSENDWYMMICSLCLEGGARPLIHKLSRPYPQYSEHDTEKKISHAQDKIRGPVLCSTIRNKTNFACPIQGCGVKTPLQLKYNRTIEINELNEIALTTGRERTNSEFITPLKHPELNSAALYGFAGKFSRLATENNEGDPAAVLFTFLTRIGVEFGPHAIFSVGDTYHYPRIFTCIVGASSKSRKGTSTPPVKRLFRFEEIKHDDLQIQIAESLPGPLSSGEGLISVAQDEVTEWRLNPDTQEGAWVTIDPGVEDKRKCIFDDEFGSALRCSKRSGNILFMVIRKLWDSGDIAPITKNSKIRATGAHIGIVTHITIEELDRLLPNVELLSGFANRFLWCFAKRQKLVPLPEPMAKNEIISMQLELLDILQVAQGINRLCFDNSAKDLWVDIYPELSADHPGLIGCVLNRAEAHTIRIAMIYALLDRKNFISAQHLQAALYTWQYAEESARLIFSGRELYSITTRIIEALKDGPKTTTDLYALFQNNIKAESLHREIHLLATQGRINLKKEKAPKGKSTMIIELSSYAKG